MIIRQKFVYTVRNVYTSVKTDLNILSINFAILALVRIENREFFLFHWYIYIS
jgi:hypothetical protein